MYGMLRIITGGKTKLKAVGYSKVITDGKTNDNNPREIFACINVGLGWRF